MARPKSRAHDLLQDSDPYVGTKEAAALLGVSVSTIQKMVESGKLKAWRTQGGHRRIAAADVNLLSREKGPAAGGQTARQSLELLMVEDNPTVVKAYSKFVGRWGSRVQVSFAGDAAAALLLIAQKKPDLVVTDLAMEPFDGFHLIRTLRASPELANTRIVVVTGLREEDIAARGGLDDLTLCYHKPLSYERLAGYIDARLQDRQHRN